MLIDRDTDPELERFYQWFIQAPVMAVDTETTGLNPYGTRKNEPDRICGMSFYAVEHGLEFSYYLSFRHKHGKNLSIRRVLKPLLSLLGERVRRREVELLFWNAKFDLHMMAADGFPLPRYGVHDYMLGAHLLNENEPSFALKEYADKYGLGSGSLDESELRTLIDRQRKFNRAERTKASEWKGCIWELSGHDVAAYAEADTKLTWLAAEMIHPALEVWGLTDLFSEVNRYNLTLCRMEQRGVQLDLDRMNAHMASAVPLVEAVKAEMADLVRPWFEHMRSRIPFPEPKIGKRGQPLKLKPTEMPLCHRVDPETFNMGSYQQIREVFGWDASDSHFLELIPEENEHYRAAQLILDYRVLSKMNRAYYDAYYDLKDPDNRLHTNYNLHGTVSGRLSSSKPNAQQIPQYSERRKVKDVFIASEGYVLIEVDYQQAELRLAAHYAQEHRMIEILRSGRDAHGETAEAMGVSRKVGKTLNFSVLYGGGARALTKLLKCPEATARSYLQNYFNLYPAFKALAQVCQLDAERHGWIRLDSGRYAHFIDPTTGYPYHDRRFRGASIPVETRKAMNRLIQGTAAECLRVAMVRIEDAIIDGNIDAHLLLQVHDSILLECRPEDIDRVMTLVRDGMTDFAFDPPMDIDAKIGFRWGQLQPYNPPTTKEQLAELWDRAYPVGKEEAA